MSNFNPILLECDNISKQYGFFFALNKISFHLDENSVLGVIGANGAGKTTLIKILAGLTSPTSGKIVIKGKKSLLKERIIKQMINLLNKLSEQ